MPHHSSPNQYLQSSGRVSQGYQSNRWRNARHGPIYKLDDYSVLHIFYNYRLACLACDDDKAYISESISGGGGWAREHWWFKLIRVCRKWRYIIFGSPSYLRLCIAYTIGAPVADMLAHQPFLQLQLPLVIEYMHKGVDNHISPGAEQGIIMALQHRGRVRRIRVHAPRSEAVFRALDGEFPNLEGLYLKIPNGPHFNWEPLRTFRTPSLRQLVLKNIICPVQSLLLTPVAGLVTLSLTNIGEPHKFSPNDLLQRLSLMPRLEILRIGFALFSNNPAWEGQLKNLPIQTHVTLPYLRRFLFDGTITYLEKFFPHISTPPLEKFQVYISNWKANSVPKILKPMSGSKNFGSYSTDLMFLEKGVFVRANLFDGTRWSALSISLHGDDFTWQVQSAARFFTIYGTCFSTTKYLTIHCRMPTRKEPRVGPDREQWHELFQAFHNVNALFVYDGSNGEISRYFQMNRGNSPIELFPSLKQLSIHTQSKYHFDPYAQFVNARKSVGYPVHLAILGRPSATKVAISCEAWEAHWLRGSFRLR